LRVDFASFAQAAFAELYPQTPFAFGWHIELVAAKLAAVRARKIRRLIVNLPPRHAKSLLASVAFPAWCLGHAPSLQILCASYAQDLADKLSRDCRRIIMSHWYRRVFATRLSAARQAMAEFDTTAEGCRLATSVGGVLTGRGADIIVIGEYNFAGQYQQAPAPLGGGIVKRAWFARYREDELPAKFERIVQSWDTANKPAPAKALIFTHKSASDSHGNGRFPNRCPGESRDLPLRRGEYFKQRQLLTKIIVGSCRRAVDPGFSPGKRMNRRARRRRSSPRRPLPFAVSLAHDCGQRHLWAKIRRRPGATELSDFSVCTSWGILGKHLYLIDVVRERFDYPELKRRVKEEHRRRRADVVPIEDKASGTQLIQELLDEGMYAATRYRPQGDKVMRLYAQTAMIENGFVHLPERAPWLALYLYELTCFPYGRHDDQVDSPAQMLDWFKAAGREDPIYACYRKRYRGAAARGQEAGLSARRPAPSLIAHAVLLAIAAIRKLPGWESRVAARHANKSASCHCNAVTLMCRRDEKVSF
jgi:predicted phage terminase large subunit-like protein